MEREITVEVANVGTAVSFVRAGLGIAFLGRLLVPDRTGLDTVRVADGEVRWQVAVATASTRRPSAATEAFLNLLRERHPAPEASAAP